MSSVMGTRGEAAAQAVSEALVEVRVGAPGDLIGRALEAERALGLVVVDDTVPAAAYACMEAAREHLRYGELQEARTLLTEAAVLLRAAQPAGRGTAGPGGRAVAKPAGCDAAGSAGRVGAQPAGGDGAVGGGGDVGRSGPVGSGAPVGGGPGSCAGLTSGGGPVGGGAVSRGGSSAAPARPRAVRG